MSNGIAEIEGVTQTLNAFALLGNRIRKKGVRRAVTKTSRSISKIAKSNAPRETGLLKKSIGQKVKTYPSGNVVGIIGPRYGFRRAVKVKISKRGKRSLRLGKKGEEGKRYRNPVNYAHLVELGTKRSRAKPFLKPAREIGVLILIDEMTQAANEEIRASKVK
jgi:HK97 gp10 family phage protein